MAQDLFEGHSYTFQQNSGSLLLLDSTDNSHEKITFREGLISSASIEILMPGDETYALKVHNYKSTAYSDGDRGIELRCGHDSINQYLVIVIYIKV